MAIMTVYKCNHKGEVVWQYQGALVDSGPNWACLVATFDRTETDLGVTVFRQGDVFTEWFYTDRWYNVFRVEDGHTGQLKGWYCNITRPAEITENWIKADDLELDVYVLPNGSVMLLDEDDFDALNLPSDERMAALRAVESIRNAAANQISPFTEIRADTEPLR